MLVTYGEAIDPSIIDPFRATKEGHHALVTGKAALLGYPDSNPKPCISALSIGDMMLKDPATAVMHFENPNDQEEINGTMISVNYHGAHSEGWHKIIVQDPSNPDTGQWVLWAPPGANNRTFYRRCALLGNDQPYQFEEQPANPDKIINYTFHAGPSDEAITSFRKLGFKFVDEILSPDSNEYGRLKILSDANKQRWAPY